MGAAAARAAPISPGAMARIREVRRLARPMSDSAWADALAERVARLTITRSDPEAFFAERSEIRSDLKRLAKHMREGGR